MRYDKDDQQSSNYEKRRGRGGLQFPFPRGRGRSFRVPVGGRGGFSLTTLIIIGVIMMFLGINPLDLLRGGIGPGGGAGFPEIPQMPNTGDAQRKSNDGTRGPFDFDIDRNARRETAPSEDEMARFMRQVLADTEKVWGRVFRSFDRQYQPPTLVDYRGGTQTGCGFGQAAMGPFYCPLDRKIYVDSRFFDELRTKFDAPGDFAQAYVIAHEVGHHVQKLLGVADKVQSAKRSMSTRKANALQVRMELQADCLAGVWANLNESMHQRLEPGDIEEGLNAASQIGDDMIQRRTQGHVVPDAFTHGSAEQRVRWFKTGFKSGNIRDCDTFNASRL